MSFKYHYTYSENFPNGLDIVKLSDLIRNDSNITSIYSHINTGGDYVDIYFETELSQSSLDALNLLISNYVYQPLEQNTELLYWVISDVKSTGTNGGTFPNNNWVTRTLNTITGPAYYVTLNNDTFTINNPGKYQIEASAPAIKVNSHQCVLYNVTNSSNALIGTSSYNTSNLVTLSCINGTIDVSAPTEFQIRHKCSTTQAKNGLGQAAGFDGLDEIYTVVKIKNITLS